MRVGPASVLLATARELRTAAVGANSVTAIRRALSNCRTAHTVAKTDDVDRAPLAGKAPNPGNRPRSYVSTKPRGGGTMQSPSQGEELILYEPLVCVFRTPALIRKIPTRQLTVSII
jgi:hypothetical protein